MDVQVETIVSRFEGLIKKVELGSKMEEGMSFPTYKMVIECDHMKREEMDNLFAIHRKQKTVEITVSDTELRGRVKKVDLGTKTIEGIPTPIYRVTLEIHGFEEDSIVEIFHVHKEQNNVPIQVACRDEQLAMKLDEPKEQKETSEEQEGKERPMVGSSPNE